MLGLPVASLTCVWLPEPLSPHSRNGDHTSQPAGLCVQTLSTERKVLSATLGLGKVPVKDASASDRLGP